MPICSLVREVCSALGGLEQEWRRVVIELPERIYEISDEKKGGGGGGGLWGAGLSQNGGGAR